MYLCILSICLNSQQDIYSKTPIDHSKSNDKKVFHKKIGTIGKVFPQLFSSYLNSYFSTTHGMYHANSIIVVVLRFPN